MDFRAEHLSVFTPLVLWFSTFLIICIVYEYLTNPLSRVPPIHWSTPWSRCFILWQIYHGNRSYAHYTGHTKTARIRPVIRVGPNEVSIMSVEGIKTVYDKGFDRSAYYRAFRNFGSLNLFSFPSRSEHSDRKRLVAPAYLKSPRMHSIIQHALPKLVVFLGSQGDGQPLIVRNIFRALATDIFTAFAFSETEGTGFLDRLKTGPNTMKQLGMEDFQLWHEDIRNSFFFFESQPELKFVSHFFNAHSRLIHGRFEAWITDIISRYEARVEERLEDESFSEHGVYWKLLTREKRPKIKDLGWRERASEIMDQMGAGQDTLACTLECIMQNLALHPNYQARLRKELCGTLPSTTFDRHFATIDNLIYLNAVVMEGLRVVSTIDSYQPRVVPAGGCFIEGHYLPGGTIVSSQPHLMNNHPDIFPSPKEFDPNRWLLSQRDYRELSKHLFTFSRGPRSCVGRQFAIAVIKTTIAEILLRFETTLVPDSDKTWKGGDEASKSEICFRKESSERRNQKIASR